MVEYVELRPLLQPRKIAELAPEAQSFKSYKAAKPLMTETSRIVGMAFSPEAPHRLAIASGTKIGLWKQGQDGLMEADGTVSKFKDVTQCVSWRSDGRLLLAGEASGSCAVVEAETRKVLRRFRNHGDAVTCSAFATVDKSRAATGSRDGKLRLWDVTQSVLLQTLGAHTDCMKYVAPGPGGPDIWISAGYDGQMRLWDLRVDNGGDQAEAKKASLCMDHGHPIETALAFPSGTMLASGGGPEIRLWDLAAGGQVVQGLSDAHSKTVTSLSLDSQASVLLSTSFDCLAKVFYVAGLQHIYTYRLPAPITCASWRPDDLAIVIGLDNGQWQLRTRRMDQDKVAAQKRSAQEAAKKVPRRKAVGNLRGLDREAASDDEIVEPERPKKKKEKDLDFYLRKFEYRKAAEILVQPTTPASEGFALVDELMNRGALQAALKDRDTAFCLQALKWLTKAFSNSDPLQVRLFFEMFHVLLDTNRCLQPPSTPELVMALTHLDSTVAQEIVVQDALAETAGMLRAVMSL
mmetsp:Transcript_27328/g.43341  ORF Transcript_27328/g.43341 Transcript_27328/m.43341 type:complete len:520 (+) Transcript_27328:53-1612(+)